MTEAGITSVELDKSLTLRMGGSLGRPLESVEYKVVPLDEHEQGGELFIRGVSLHSGRLENGMYRPALTDSEGWLRTGDKGILIGGRLLLDGRLKDVIVNESGENVYPDELEDYFDKLADADQICILGVKNKTGYEDITLVAYGLKLVSASAELMNLSGEIQRMNRALPVYKRVSSVLISHDALPTANGIKVKRLKLKAMIEDGSLACSRLDLKSAIMEETGIIQAEWRINQLRDGWTRAMIRTAAGLKPEIRLPQSIRDRIRW
jgi:long-subunit acyl-CoA synthetase (AMP-forming)